MQTIIVVSEGSEVPDKKSNKIKDRKKSIRDAIEGKGPTYQDKEEVAKDSVESSRNKKDVELARRLKKISRAKKQSAETQ